MDKKLFKIIKSGEDFSQVTKTLLSEIQGQCLCFVNADKFLRESFLEVVLSAYYCEDEQARPCGECPKCKQVSNGNNVDICYFGEEGVQVKKEELERFLECAITKPYEYKHKFLVIRNGDGLTDLGQNMLLKMLEELPAFNTVILLFSATQKILPTIKSRSTIFLLHSLEYGDVVQMLGSSERALNIINCTDANLGKALDLESSKDFDAFFNYAKTLLYNMEKSTDVVKYVNFAQVNKDKLETLLLVVKGVFYMALKGKLESILSADKLARAVELVTLLEIDLAKHQNRLMVIDNLLIGLVKIKNEVK